jgi:hypothetical protein
MTNNTAIEELTIALLKECSNDSILKEIPEENIREIINTLVQQQFIRNDDNGRHSQVSINRILTSIVDEIFERGK